MGKNKDIPTDPNTLQNWIPEEAAFCQLAGKSDNVLVAGSQESVQNGDSCATAKKASASRSKGAARGAPWRPTPQRFVSAAAGHQPCPCGGSEAGMQLRPPPPPRGRQGAAGRGRRRVSQRGQRGLAPGTRLGVTTGTLPHRIPSRPVPRAARGGGARLLPPPPRGGSERPVAAAALRITGHIIAGAARFRACPVAAALT